MATLDIGAVQSDEPLDIGAVQADVEEVEEGDAGIMTLNTGYWGPTFNG